MNNKTVRIATRGSALALAQANTVLAECQSAFPGLSFELNVIKTTGDKLQAASVARIDATLPRGLFTKELEEALLGGEATLAVHSLKDLPTILPPGLKLGAVSSRADVRDVLIYPGEQDFAKRGFKPGLKIHDLPDGATVGTSSTRRSAQLLQLHPALRIAAIRGNVGTRLHKLASQPELNAIILAAAGLQRLGFNIDSEGRLTGTDVPEGLYAIALEPEEMIPCVGQAALGLEIRENHPLAEEICERFNDAPTWHCVTAERAFLRAMGGGCQSAVGACAQIVSEQIRLRAVSFLGGAPRKGEVAGPLAEAESLGEQLAAQLI